nr:T-cell receptor alpha [Hippoglossus hippoglossus]
MLSLHQSLSSLLLLSTLTAISHEELRSVNNEEFSAEGSTVTLSYNYTTVNPTDYFYWYRQYPGQAPEFLLSRSASGQVAAPTSGLSIKVEQNLIHMIISSAAVTDSAVYYCAVKPHTGGSYKIVFGSGTRLIVEPRDDYEPSYYELEDENQTIRACLATGFSRNNATLLHDLFKNQDQSGAVRAADDSLHSEVVLMSEGSGGKCENGTHQNEPDVCADTLDKDVTVNTVSLLVVALRLLFLKTVVFNVLMTLRLWLSH